MTSLPTLGPPVGRAAGPLGVAPEPQAAAEQDARKVAAQFEKLLLGELLKAMRAAGASPDDGDNAFASGTYREMFDTSIIDAAAGGLGLGDALTRQLGGTTGASGARTIAATMPLFPGAAPSDPPAVRRNPIDDAPWRPDRARITAGELATPAIGTAFTGGTPTPGLWPVDGGRQSSDYGYRMHPIHKEKRFHGGIDIAAPEGREIRAVDRGVVTFAGRHRGYGNMVEIRHPDGATTRYAHASRLHVREGDAVDVGETIADVGSTGQSTGPHLHFEVRERGHTIDPEAYLERLRSAASAPASQSRTGVAAVRTSNAVGTQREEP